MRKRIRGLLVILVLAAVAVMLYPSFQWYFIWNEGQREAASYPIQTIRDTARNFAGEGFLAFQEQFTADRSAEIDLSKPAAGLTPEALHAQTVRYEAFQALRTEAVKRLKKAKVPVPKTITYDAVKAAFVTAKKGDTLDSLEVIARQSIIDFLEGVKREALFAAKDKSGRIIQLGLDLAGGVSYVLEADTKAYAVAQDKAQKEIEYRQKLEELRKDNPEAELDFETFTDYTKYDLASNLNAIMEIAVEQISNRVDIYGASEPDIRRLGNNWIQVDLPGAKDPERLRRLLMGKGALNFHVQDIAATQKLNEWMAENEGTPLYEQTLKSFKEGEELKVPAVVGIPAHEMAVGQYEKDAYREDERVGWIVVNRDPGMPGNQVQRAGVYRAGDSGEIGTSFVLSSEGQDSFGEMTKGATEETPINIAVLMDGKCKMAAAARQQLKTSNLQVSGRGIDFQEAEDFAKLLNVGSKDVAVTILSSDVIGSGLGADYVHSGISALFWGLVAVVVFMIFYYLNGGLVAVVALLMNIFIMAGILSQIQLTLTLAGLAGFVLTVGMSVDANVIIFERIKEEMRLGKSPKSSVAAGFQKAFWTILDSNITTFIAALVLSYFGSGTVKGFALILAVGIFSSMFTALFVSKLLLDVNVETFKVKKLLISWRRK